MDAPALLNVYINWFLLFQHLFNYCILAGWADWTPMCWADSTPLFIAGWVETESGRQRGWADSTPLFIAGGADSGADWAVATHHAPPAPETKLTERGEREIRRGREGDEEMERGRESERQKARARARE